MNVFNDLTKFINCFADILNAVNFHSMHSKIIGSNDIFLGIIKEYYFFLEVRPFENTLPEKILFPVFS